MSVCFRLEKKEKLRKEKEKEKAKKDKEEKEAKEANAKKERKRVRRLCSTIARDVIYVNFFLLFASFISRTEASL